MRWGALKLKSLEDWGEVGRPDFNGSTKKPFPWSSVNLSFQYIIDSNLYEQLVFW
jgi:hypothetical protein